jgi:HK97 family phage portal protein
MAHILLWGNGYAEKIRNGYGEIVELWPITPNRVRPHMKDSEFVYGVRVDSEEIIMPRDKILHIPGLGFDGFMGYSVISMANKSIGLGMALETFGSMYFGQGTHPGVIISHPNTLSAQANSNLRTSLAETYSGLGKSHRLMLLEEGMKIEKLGIPPNDSQFLESRQFQIPEVARWFNLPPHKLKDLTKSSFSNIESEQLSFVIDSLLPWLVTLEQNYNMQLLTASDKSLSGYGRLYFKHIVEGLLRGDTASRAEFYSKMFNIGAFSINEIREKEDMNPIPGGDIHLVPLNMTSLENAGKPLVASTPPVEPTPILPKTGNGKGKEHAQIVQ